MAKTGKGILSRSGKKGLGQTKKAAWVLPSIIECFNYAVEQKLVQKQSPCKASKKGESLIQPFKGAIDEKCEHLIALPFLQMSRDELEENQILRQFRLAFFKLFLEKKRLVDKTAISLGGKNSMEWKRSVLFVIMGAYTLFRGIHLGLVKNESCEKYLLYRCVWDKFPLPLRSIRHAAITGRWVNA